MSRQPFEREYEHPAPGYGPALTQESVVAFALEAQKAGRVLDWTRLSVWEEQSLIGETVRVHVAAPRVE